MFTSVFGPILRVEIGFFQTQKCTYCGNPTQKCTYCGNPTIPINPITVFEKKYKPTILRTRKKNTTPDDFEDLVETPGLLCNPFKVPLVLRISFKNQMFTSVFGPILRVEIGFFQTQKCTYCGNPTQKCTYCGNPTIPINPITVFEKKYKPTILRTRKKNTTPDDFEDLVETPGLLCNPFKVPLVLRISFKNQMFTSVFGPILRVENVPWR